ncbi:MAG: ADP-ribosylglycohydrolase family protein [Candidatus Kaiserbacteria bacterium]|nr:ADP-ribosylglycohydrolase family protein [Candidatus Kaiserbacteria bacterium]MCB9816643.1 ADP-ribosylglycohydrolase family protein [Candidatus Nomurabacteria bacterium]
MIDLIDRYRGALVGVHVGDSLGAPDETLNAKQVADAITCRRGLRMISFRSPWDKKPDSRLYPAGFPTDDSDQTADLAASLIECGGLDTDHLRIALQRSAVQKISRLHTLEAMGVDSKTTLWKALSDDPMIQAMATSNEIGTNGSLMRSAPMALWFGPGMRSKLPSTRHYDLVRSMSAVTHVHPHSIETCWVYTNVLGMLLNDDPFPLDALVGHEPVTVRIRSRLEDSYDFPYDPGGWPARGTAEFSLYVALYSLKHAKSFAEGIEMAIRVGGDTDTYAAIAGGLLGAKFGYESIPEEWRNTILGHDQMVTYAEQLYERRRNK